MNMKTNAIRASLILGGLAALGTVTARQVRAADQPAPGKAAGHTVMVDEKANNTSVTLRQGDLLVVRLVSNASTGFSWQISSQAAPQLVPVGKPVYEPAPRKPGGPPIVGAPGHQVFTFRAASTGDTALAFGYKRAWEKKSPPAQTYRLKVSVKS